MALAYLALLGQMHVASATGVVLAGVLAKLPVDNSFAKTA